MTFSARAVATALAAVVAGTCAVGLAAPSAQSAAPARALVAKDAFRGTEDKALSVRAPGVLRNDAARRSVRKISVVTKPAHGTVLLRRDGSFRYQPRANWSGRDSFRYRVVDKHGKRGTATVSLTIAPV